MKKINMLFAAILVIFSLGCSGGSSDSTTTVSHSWTHPANLSDNISPGTNAWYPALAMGDNGDAIIAWTDSYSLTSRLYKSEYRSGTWTHPASDAIYISPDGQNAGEHQAAMDKDGNTIIVWVEHNGTNQQIYKSEYRNGTWTHPVSFSDFISIDGQTAGEPQVAMDNDGNTIIVWVEHNGTNQQIYKSEYRSGTWTHPSSLSDNISPSGRDAEEPRVSMDDNGNAVIVWRQYNGASWMIYKSEYRSGTWTHPASLAQYINPNNGQTAGSHQIAMDNNGNAIIVWMQYSNSYWHIYKSEYRSSTWTHPVSVSDYISPNGQNVGDPQLAMDNDGNAMIVWQQSNGTNNKIFKSEYRNGTWTHPASLTDNISPDGANARTPKVAMDDNGNAIIVWDADGAYYQIFKSEYRNGTWTHPASLTDNISPDGQDAQYPQVAMDNNDNTIIVWRQYDGANYKIFKSEYR